MRKHAALIVLVVLSVTGFAAFTVWAFLDTAHLAGGWGSLIRIWPFVVGGVLVVGLLGGGLMWLAFYSANHGYDDGVDDHLDP